LRRFLLLGKKKPHRLAGAVQDFIVLFISSRRDGRSLGDLIKSELGEVPGVIALFGVLMIMIIILAVLALVVVKALAESPTIVPTLRLVICTMTAGLGQGVAELARAGEEADFRIGGKCSRLHRAWKPWSGSSSTTTSTPCVRCSWA
jgi:hypothetical protein